MKSFVFLILLFAVSPSPRLMPQGVFGDAPIRFVLPAAVEPGGCRFQYQAVGPFGSVIGPMSLKPDAFEFDIQTVSRGYRAII